MTDWNADDLGISFGSFNEEDTIRSKDDSHRHADDPQGRGGNSVAPAAAAAPASGPSSTVTTHTATPVASTGVIPASAAVASARAHAADTAAPPTTPLPKAPTTANGRGSGPEAPSTSQPQQQQQQQQQQQPANPAPYLPRPAPVMSWASIAATRPRPPQKPAPSATPPPGASPAERLETPGTRPTAQAPQPHLEDGGGGGTERFSAAATEGGLAGEVASRIRQSGSSADAGVAILGSGLAAREQGAVGSNGVVEAVSGGSRVGGGSADERGGGMAAAGRGEERTAATSAQPVEDREGSVNTATPVSDRDAEPSTTTATSGNVTEHANGSDAAVAAEEEKAAAAAAATARAKAEAEAAAASEAKAAAEAKAAEEAKAAAEAAELAERMWKSLLQMLGREDGLSMATQGGLVGSGRPPAGGLVHRGLVNTGNSCFRNSVLQALLACEPFVEVLFRVAPGLRNSVPAQEALPTWAQMTRFAAAFEPPKPGVPAPLGGGGGGGSSGEGGAWSMAKGRNRGSGGGGGGGGRYHRATTSTVEPVYPDEAMSRAFGAFRAANMGEQEDAQEFLAFFLDQLHEEIVDAKKKHEQTWQQEGLSCDGSSGGGGGGREEEGEEDAWLEVGKGGAKAVVNAPDPKRKISNSSVVTGLFYGMFRSEVKKHGAKPSVTLEAFHCLQLDLDPPPSSAASQNNNPSNGYNGSAGSTRGATAGHGDLQSSNGGGRGGRGGSAWGTAGGRGQQQKPRGEGYNGGGGGRGAWGGAWSGGGAGSMPSSGGPGATILESALAALFGGEAVSGVKGKQDMEVKASRTLTLEQAPKVLTLHLKQFSFHPELGPRKLARRVRYPLELEIPNRIMSPALKSEAKIKGPLKYRLFTVVLHHGRSLHGGHYTALVRDPLGEWKHYDDHNVSPETEGHALNPMSGHPYLLLYTQM